MGTLELTFEEKCARVFEQWKNVSSRIDGLKGIVQNPNCITGDNADEAFKQFNEGFKETTLQLWELYGDVATLMGEKAGKQFDKVPKY